MALASNLRRLTEEFNTFYTLQLIVRNGACIHHYR